MKSVFVDTAGWMMMADAANPHHAASCTARDDWLRKGGVFVTTDYVMDETLTILRMRLGLRAASGWWAQVEPSPRVVWERIDAERAEKARAWFFRWRDKSFSFTDCTSFVVMTELKIKAALTSDKHFTQAGFRILPAPARRK